MTVTTAQLVLYAWALLVLFLVPGPVWLAITARGIAGGFWAAWPVACAVVIGDILWPLVAIKGVSWIIGIYGNFLVVLRFAGAAMFVWMGVMLIRHASRQLSPDSRLTRPGVWAGFSAGLLVILGNPKAILFYMGILPGFFDITRITWIDIVVICGLSALIPFVGNTMLALLLDRVRRFLSSPEAMARSNRVAGSLLILVGLMLPWL